MTDLIIMLHNTNPAGSAVMLHTIDLNGVVPAEIQMLPYGVFNTPKYGKLIVDDESVTSVMGMAMGQTNDMVIDYEHQSFAEPPIAAPAAGWVKIKNLINKGKQGIWAIVDWTPKAKELIANKEYRYFSPVTWTRNSDGKVLGLMGGGLTNLPNIDGMVPLTNKSLQAGKPASLQADLTSHKEGQSMKALAALLGLPETATEEEIAAAIKKLIETASGGGAAVATNKAVVTALGLAETAQESEITGTIMAMKAGSTQHADLLVQVNSLKTRLAARDEADIEVLVNSAIAGDGKGAKLLPAQKEWAMGYAKRDLDGFKVFLNKAPYAVVTGKIVADDNAGGSSQLDETQVQINKMLGITDETFKKHNPVAA